MILAVHRVSSLRLGYSATRPAITISLCINYWMRLVPFTNIYQIFAESVTTLYYYVNFHRVHWWK